MLKTKVLQVVGQTANEIDQNLSREQKFEVFIRVCDGLLNDGRITKTQHRSWTHVF